MKTVTQLRADLTYILDLLTTVRSDMTAYTPAVSKREPFRQIQINLKLAQSMLAVELDLLAGNAGYEYCTYCSGSFRAYVPHHKGYSITTEGMPVPTPVCTDCLPEFAKESTQNAALVRAYRKAALRVDTASR